MDIFISYSRQDRERVGFIAEALQAEGYSVWWDRDIRAGEEFDDVIDKAIKKSAAIVVVWSKTSIRSNWVKEEAEDGVEDDKLVPALIDEVVIPRGFRRIQAAELQDASENPTQSANWPEFLDSIHKIAGQPNGEGATAGDTAVQGLTSAAASRPAPTPPPAASSVGGSSWKRFVPAGAAALALVAALVIAAQFFNPFGKSPPPPPEDMTPIVLGIYPEEGFGEDQRLGLTSALSGSDIDVIHLTATLDAMKGRDAPELIEALKANLEKRNVIAIVGPSITELTPEVLNVVEESGREPAIILTTAAPRQAIGWDESPLPLFRVGSGVDERAKQFALLARSTVTSGTELVLLYESVPNSTEKTYGEVFFDRIKDNLPEWNQWMREDKVHDISYLRGKIMDSLERPAQQRHFNERKMVVVVGLSSDFIALAVNMYRADQPERAALLGGWNTGKAVRDLGREMDIQHTRLFDMTDVVSSPAEVRGLPDSRRFEKDFGELNAAKRQEAVAFDSALVVKQAVAQIEEGTPITAEALVDVLRSRDFTGITGEIEFAENGQNAGEAGGRSLRSLIYDPAQERWSVIPGFDDMLRTDVASR